MFVGKSPLRISFAGGGTDLEEYHNKFEGCTISFTIDLSTWITAKKRKDSLIQGFSPDFSSYIPPTKHKNLKNIKGHEIIVAGLKQMNFKKGVDMYLSSDVKPNSGLGASSSLTANLVNVILKLEGTKWPKSKIAMKAYHIGHNILKWGIGKQDEFAAVHGGLNVFKYTKEKVIVKSIKLNTETRRELQRNSLLFRLGDRKHSVNLLQNHIKNINESKQITINALHTAKNLAIEMRDALRGNDLEKFSDILDTGWNVKKKFTRGITNPRIEKISREAFKHGAKSLKVTGAGGGGHMFMYVEPKFHKKVQNRLEKLGVQRVNFTYQDSGASVVDLNSL